MPEFEAAAFRCFDDSRQVDSRYSGIDITRRPRFDWLSFKDMYEDSQASNDSIRYARRAQRLMKAAHPYEELLHMNIVRGSR
jgi:hypothetical protein